MSLQLNFTQAALDRLLPAKQQYDVRDSKIIGLYLRVNPGGSKTYNLYRKIDGRPHRIKIGRFCDFSVMEARERAMRLNVMIADGINPQHEKQARRQELTFKQIFDHYYKEHALVFNKDPQKSKGLMDRHIMPAIGNHKLSAITLEKVKQLHTKIGEHHQVTANRVINLISAVYNFGLRESHYKGTNPCAGLRRFKVYSRDRFLSKTELTSFFDAVNQEAPLIRDYFLALLYTGVRKSNLLAARYEDIDFNLARWRIPETQTKNKEVNIVVLSSAALEVFKRRKEENDKRYKHQSNFVFPAANPGKHIKTPRQAFNRIKARMGVTDIRIHDLRRTLGSYMAISGASLPIIGKALNHKSQTATVTYARLANEPVLHAVNAATELMIIKRA
jgi:integrase